MKRLTALTLVIVMVLGVSVTGYAAPDWKQGGGLPPGIQKKVTLSVFANLRDLDIVPWAKNAMEKMCVKGLIKGYEDNTFKPKASVSQLEAVVMALRVLGWEEDARSSKYASNLVSKYRGGKLDPWAYGYVNVAYEKGILDEVDLMYFNPNSAAKRWEVAKYFVRALGKEDIAEDHMGDKLDFKDYTAIPVGAVGYIYVMNDLGLMVGNKDGTFNPNGAVSRAEMAVLLERIDDRVDRDTDGNEIYGRVVDIDARGYELKLDVDGSQKWYEGIEGIAVYKDGEYYDFDDLKRGDYVEILLNSSGKVIFIELKDDKEDKIISDYRGEVRDVDVRNSEITIKSGSAVFTFSVKSNADIRLNGKDADLKDIKAGDSVRLKVDDRNRVIKLSAQGDHDVDDSEKFEGTIYSVTNTRRVKEITVKLENRRLQTYDVDSDTEITLDGKRADLDDLESGMEVEVLVQDDTALEIDAKSVDYTRQVEGTIYRLRDSQVRVKVGNNYYTFNIDKDTLVYIDEKRAEVGDLMADMPVVVRYEGDTALRIVAESLSVKLEGVITGLSAKDVTITVKVGNSYKTLNVNRNTSVRVNGKAAGFKELVVGMDVELEVLNDNTVDKLNAQLEKVEGTVVSLDTDDMEITVRLYNTNVTYSLDKDVRAEADGQRIRLGSIGRRDQVVLEFDDGLVTLIKVD